MKTGQDVGPSGLYVSECCLSVVALVKDQMFHVVPVVSHSRRGKSPSHVGAFNLQTAKPINLFPTEFLNRLPGLVL